MKWQLALKEYTTYLNLERGLSKHSIAAYSNDVNKLISYLENTQLSISPIEVDKEVIHQFIYEVAKVVNPRSQSRIISGLRSFFDYLVFENRKGICAGYAQLFYWFMQEIDIETNIVTGYIRDERNHYIELELDFDSRHAWNAIKINEKWILVDSTWGTSQDSTVSDFYFDMKPEWAIISHFPDESKWQLLKKHISIEEFNNSKFIKPIWFFVGFSNIPELKKVVDTWIRES